LKNIIINILKFLVFLGVGLVILYFVYQNQNEAYQAQCALDGVAAADCSLMQKVIVDFKSVRIPWLLAAFAAYVMSNVSRAIRWQMLLKSLGKPVRFINSFLATMLGYFANLGLPRLGEVLRPLSMSKYEKIPVEKVLGTVVVDRTMDVISLLLIISLAFLLEFDTLWGYLNENMSSEGGSLLTNPIVLGILGLGGLVVILTIVFRKKIQATAFYKKIEQVLLGFWDGILSIKNLDQPGWFIFHSINIWVGYFLMFYCYMPSFGPTEHLGPTVALMAFVFNSGDAFSSANISFFGTHFCNIVLGLIAVIFLPIINKNYHPEPLTEDRENVDVIKKKPVTLPITSNQVVIPPSKLRTLENPCFSRISCAIALLFPDLQ